eukprot:CAMPEP_0198226306 /NCGR_PEP_ID=MMETSP1445-20131203/104841_1 /TAXON_ID=36898 /ORGANISM="Pyramimonas sp., Strain CCMP2087" /LENGTH=549 /DNA_ID=CAMNT_0043906091 /DNA_START=147 /DNA_END=1792 /DNA_ORIENTATION=+
MGSDTHSAEDIRRLGLSPALNRLLNKVQVSPNNLIPMPGDPARESSMDSFIGYHSSRGNANAALKATENQAGREANMKSGLTPERVRRLSEETSHSSVSKTESTITLESIKPKKQADSLFEVSCQYDDRFRELDQMAGKGISLHNEKPERKGPVWTLFECYSHLRVAEGADRKAGVGGQRAQHFAMTKLQLFEMLEDFEVIPDIRRADATLAFKVSYQEGPQENKKRAQPGADEIQFPEFANCLARLALIVFAPKSDHGLPFSARPKSSRASFETWRHKVKALLALMGADNSNTKLLRAKLGQFMRNAKERRLRAVEKKWEYVVTEDATPEVRAAVSSEVTTDITNCIMKNEGHEEREAWVQFRKQKINCGTIQLIHGYATRRKYRIVLRNRADRQVNFNVRIDGVPMMEGCFSERPLAPGIPRVLELKAEFEELGSFTGTVSIELEDGSEVSVPIAAKVELLMDTSSGVPSHMIPIAQLKAYIEEEEEEQNLAGLSRIRHNIKRVARKVEDIGAMTHVLENFDSFSLASEKRPLENSQTLRRPLGGGG